MQAEGFVGPTEVGQEVSLRPDRLQCAWEMAKRYQRAGRGDAG